MSLRFIGSDFIASVKSWVRSPGTVFWTILFPILLIMIFGAIFSGAQNVEYEIGVQNLDDQDDTGFTQSFTMILDNIDVLKIKTLDKGENIENFMVDEDISATIVIPEGFGLNVSTFNVSQNDLPVNVILYVDPADQTTSSVVRAIITGVLQDLNMNVTGGVNIIGLEEKSSIGEDFEFIDFFIPGIIGLTIMTSMVYGSIERNTKFRKDGILRKLLTMPVTRAEWIFSKMLFMLFLSFISTSVILVVGTLVWDLNFKLNIFFPVIIVSTSFMFSGMGMIIGRFVKEEETADMAGGAITFPMMFLAGTFFPLEQMPDFLRTIAQFLPLYYVNEGLRNAMIYEHFDKTLYFTGFVLVFAAIFFIAGVFLTKWEED